MDDFNELTRLCQRRWFNVSLAWQKIGDWSVKIYTGHNEHSCELWFCTDGHTDKRDAIREGLAYMRELDAKKVVTKAPQF